MEKQIFVVYKTPGGGGGGILEGHCAARFPRPWQFLAYSHYP